MRNLLLSALVFCAALVLTAPAAWADDPCPGGSWPWQFASGQTQYTYHWPDCGTSNHADALAVAAGKCKAAWWKGAKIGASTRFYWVEMVQIDTPYGSCNGRWHYRCKSCENGRSLDPGTLALPWQGGHVVEAARIAGPPGEVVVVERYVNEDGTEAITEDYYLVDILTDDGEVVQVRVDSATLAAELIVVDGEASEKAAP